MSRMIGAWGLVLVVLMALWSGHAHADGSVPSGTYYWATGTTGCNGVSSPVVTFSSASALWACEVNSCEHIIAGGPCVSFPACSFNTTGSTSSTYQVNSPGGTGCPLAGSVESGGINTSATACPSNSTTSTAPCSCAAGFVPSGSSCVASSTYTAEVTHVYGVGTQSGALSPYCTGAVPPVCSAPGSSASTASAACATNNVSSANMASSCTLVQGYTCICSVTFSDGSPTLMKILPMVDYGPCIANPTACKAAISSNGSASYFGSSVPASSSLADLAVANNNAGAAAAAAQAAAIADAARAAGLASLGGGGTPAAAVTAATTAATAAASPVQSGAVAQYGAYMGGAVASAMGALSSSGNSPASPTDYARQGEAASAASSVVASQNTGFAAVVSAVNATDFPFTDVASKLGGIPSTETVSGVTPTFSTSAISFTAVTGCPADLTFTLTMTYIAGTYHISFQPLCDLGTTLRPLFLALGAITAAFIFASGLTI
jgi:hypothetical protein